MIQVGDTVRVIADGLFNGQEVKVLRHEQNSRRRRKTSSWYLLDTIHPKLKISYPAWFEIHEIEKVEVEHDDDC
jgi:hypothetical protein